MLIFRFFLYSNLFIAACAVLMVQETLLWQNYTAIDVPLLCFVFFATLASYSFHWLLTKPQDLLTRRLAWLRHNKVIHLAILFFSIVSLGYLWHHYFQSKTGVIAAAALPTFLYSAPKINWNFFIALRKIAVAKTLFLTLVWTYVTAVLPLLLVDISFTETAWWMIGYRFTLIYAICILFDYRDRIDDQRSGIHSLITILSPPKIKQLFVLCSLLCVLCILGLLFATDNYWGSAFLFIAIVFVFCLYKRGTTEVHNDILYYFILDGLMAFSALLIICKEYLLKFGH